MKNNPRKYVSVLECNIHEGFMKDGDYECNDEEINTVLNYYKITRDDAEAN